MGKFIVRNQEHFSKHIVSFVFENNEHLTVVKSSTDLSSRVSIENEIIGYEWYCQHGGLISPKIIKDYKDFLSISIPYINGINKNPVYGYTFNKKCIKLIVQEYKRVWKSEVFKNNTALHGDFSIGNVIFNGDNVVIIDWEHFSPEGFPIGLDLLNLIFEQLWFEKRMFGIMDRTLDSISNLVRELVSEGYVVCKDKCYLKYLTSIINSTHTHWGEQFKKMPILKFTSSEVSYIDKYFSKD
jgi:hypothetical protein